MKKSFSSGSQTRKQKKKFKKIPGKKIIMLIARHGNIDTLILMRLPAKYLNTGPEGIGPAIMAGIDEGLFSNFS
jgi:hypothetical protein